LFNERNRNLLAPNSRRIQTIARNRRIPLHCYPRQATFPGSKAALIAPNGNIQLLCTVERLKGPIGVRLASGEFKQGGYELVAKRGSVLRHPTGAHSRLGFRWKEIGQLRYFDRYFRPITITPDRQDGPYLSKSKREPPPESPGVRFRPFAGEIPGVERDHPEARLVRRYTRWVDSLDHFKQAQHLSDGCRTDLFNTTTWTLFEAKSRTDDASVREAFGQLHDYRRWFKRSPRLAILLPRRPRQRLLAFLAHFGVVAVWERSNRTFTDSAEGRLTANLRIVYRERALTSR
jgi:hypothetical protein